MAYWDHWNGKRFIFNSRTDERWVERIRSNSVEGLVSMNGLGPMRRLLGEEEDEQIKFWYQLQKCTSVSSLRLEGCAVSACQAALTAMTLCFEKNPYLTSISMPYCGLTDYPVTSLASTIQDRTQLTLLDLTRNPFQDGGLEAIGSLLLGPDGSLNVLRVADCHYTKAGAVVIAFCLETNTSLTELDLRGAQLRPEDHEVFAPPLVKYNTSLKALFLGEHTTHGLEPQRPYESPYLDSFGDATATKFAEVLRVNPALEALSLGEFSGAGAAALADAVPFAKSLTSLHVLQPRRLGRASALAFAEATKRSICGASARRTRRPGDDEESFSGLAAVYGINLQLVWREMGMSIGACLPHQTYDGEETFLHENNRVIEHLLAEREKLVAVALGLHDRIGCDSLMKRHGFGQDILAVIASLFLGRAPVHSARQSVSEFVQSRGYFDERASALDGMKKGTVRVLDLPSAAVCDRVRAALCDESCSLTDFGCVRAGNEDVGGILAAVNMNETIQAVRFHDFEIRHECFESAAHLLKKQTVLLDNSRFIRNEGYEDAAAFLQMLKAPHFAQAFSNLKHLSLHATELDDDAFSVLAQLLSSGALNLELLDITPYHDFRGSVQQELPPTVVGWKALGEAALKCGPMKVKCRMPCDVYYSLMRVGDFRTMSNMHALEKRSPGHSDAPEEAWQSPRSTWDSEPVAANSTFERALEEFGEHIKEYDDDLPEHSLGMAKCYLNARNHVGMSSLNELLPFETMCGRSIHSVVHVAVEACDEEFLLELHANGFGAMLEAASADGCTPAMLASERGDVRMIKLLRDCGVSLQQFCRANAYGITPAHAACRMGHHQIIKILACDLPAQASFFAKDCRGRLPAHFAAMSGSGSCLSALARHGASATLFMADKNGKTPEMLGSWSESVRRAVSVARGSIAQTSVPA